MRGWGRTCEGVTRHSGDYKTKYYFRKKIMYIGLYTIHVNWLDSDALDMKQCNAWLTFFIFTSPSLLQMLGSTICSLTSSV